MTSQPSRVANRISNIVEAFILVGLLLFSIPASSTSVVAFLINGKVVIASDSKEQVFINGRETTRNVCKLHVGSNLVWAVYGLVGEENGINKIEPAIDAIANTNKSMASKVSDLDQLAFDYIHHVASDLRRDDPVRFATFINNGPELLSTLYVGFGREGVTVSNRDYVISLVKGKINVESRWALDCPGGNCANPQMFVLGTENGIEGYIWGHPNARFPSSVDTAQNTAVNMVSIELAASPDAVGPPINTMVVSASGIEWGKDNSPDCNGKDKSPTAKPSKTAIKGAPLPRE